MPPKPRVLAVTAFEKSHRLTRTRSWMPGFLVQSHQVADRFGGRQGLDGVGGHVCVRRRFTDGSEVVEGRR